MPDAGPWNDYAPGTGAAPASPDVSTAAPAAGGGGPWNDYAPGTGVSTGADVYKGATSGVIRGTAGLPTAPGGVVSLTQKPFDWLGNKIAQGVEAAHPGWGQYVPSQENIEKYYAEHPEAPKPPGVGGRPSALTEAGSAGSRAITDVLDPASAAIGGGTSTYQPTTGWGEAAQLGGEFLPGAVGGEASLLPLAGRLVTRAAIPAAGAYVGGKAAPAMGLSPETGQMIGGVLAGAAPAAVEATGAGQLLMPKIDPELAAAAERQGVQLPVAAAAESIPVQQFGQIIKNLPIANIPLVKGAERAQRQMAAAAERAAASVGATAPNVAGQVIKGALDDWNDGIRPDVTAAFEGTRNMVDQTASTVPLDATRGVAQDIATQYQGMRQPLPPSVQKVLDAVTDPNGLTFNNITDLRTMIGKLKNNWGQVTAQGMNPAELERLYGGLTQDAERSAMAGGGQQAVDAWRQARDLQISVAGRRQAISKVVGLQAQSPPEAVMAKIQTMAGSKGGADIDTLNQIRSMIGRQDWDQVAGSIGQNFGFIPQTGEFSAQRFATAYSKLSDAGKDALFGPAGTPGLRQAYDDLATLGARAHILQRYSNPSGTSQSVGGFEELAGLYFEPMATISTLIGGTAVSALLGRPATASSLARFSRVAQAQSLAQQAGKASLAGMRNLYGAARNLSNTAKAAGINISPGQLVPAALPPGQQGQQQ